MKKHTLFSISSHKLSGTLLALALLLVLPPSSSAIAATSENERLRLQSGPDSHTTLTDKRGAATWDLGAVTAARLSSNGNSIVLSVALETTAPLSLLTRALPITAAEAGCVLVPAREGLLIPSSGSAEFTQAFPTSDYEGCHMNMLGFLKGGAALLMTWDDPYLTPELKKTKTGLTCSVMARRPPHGNQASTSLTLTPLGQGDWNTVATAYREVARAKGLVVTMRDKIKRNPEAEKLLGASNAKLWQCLFRRRNEESTKDEEVKVNWTFDEAARVAEHLKNDLGMDRCLFTIGGWTEGGYDCRHPDALPANPECGGNVGLADATARIRALGYVACFHDNYQDMYRDAKSWDEGAIQKRRNGALMTGGRWLGGRAYLVCAPETLALANRPQNLPAVQKLFAPQAYFIDTTYAVGPQECFDPQHPLNRGDDIRWKQKLSDYSRDVFGLFGSECGREWAIPHSDFFEGLSGVSGNYYHNNINPEKLGATVIPLFEMVYHDCEVIYGKYGYRPERAAEYVTQHVLLARTLNYHSIPTHLYWKEPAPQDERPLPESGRGCFARADGGWAEKCCRPDVFMKNTHEILGPLAALTAHARLAKLEFLTPDRAVRRATWTAASGVVATVTVNFGAAPFDVQSPLGGTVSLPQWGFLVESPGYVAFHAQSWGGRKYDKPVLFTIKREGTRERIFHGFGDARLTWRGQELTVSRESEVRGGVRIGLVTDTHFARALPDRAGKVNAAIEFFNERGVDAVLALGDLYEGHFPALSDYLADKTAFEPLWQRAKAPVHWVLGNHDHWGITNDQFLKDNPYLPGINYTFDIGPSLRFVVYSNVDGRYFEATTSTLTWLRTALAQAGREGKQVIVATHARIDQDYPGTPPAWTKEPYSAFSYNSKAQREIIDRAVANGVKIRYVLQGHHHRNAESMNRGVKYLTFAALAEKTPPVILDFSKDGQLTVSPSLKPVAAKKKQ